MSAAVQGARRLRRTSLLVVVVSAIARAGSVAAQSGPAAIPLQPAPGIEGVIAAGTRPEVIATGLMGADDPIWVPNLGLVFSEPNANRIVRLPPTRRAA